MQLNYEINNSKPEIRYTEQEDKRNKIKELIDIFKLDDAEKELYEYNSLFNIKSEFYILKSTIEIKKGQFENALNTIQYGLFEYPKTYELLYLLGYIYEKLDSLLEANDAYIRALRQAANEKEKIESQESVSRIASIIENTSFTKADYAKSMYKVISIFCYGRSGTHFFKSLLDDHPETIVTMLNGIKILNLWESEIKDKIKVISIEYIVDRIFEVLHTEFNDGKIYDEPKLNGMYVMGENRDEFYSIDKIKFQQEFISIINDSKSIDAKFFYQAIQLAASYALGRTYDFTKGIPVIIEGGIHFSTYTDLTQQFLNVFPYTKLIHMVRNPVASVASTVKSLAVSGIGDINLLCSNLIILLNRVPMVEEWINRTFLIKLEDLHTKPHETLELVCDLLEINWNDSLMKSTFGGIKWWNTITSEVVTGFNTKIISKSNEDVLSLFDKFRFEALLNIKHKAWGYGSSDFFDFEILKKLLEYPFKFEKLFSNNDKEYIFNRRIIYKCLLKNLKEENILGQEDRYECKVRLLSPDVTGSI